MQIRKSWLIIALALAFAACSAQGSDSSTQVGEALATPTLAPTALTDITPTIMGLEPTGEPTGEPNAEATGDSLSPTLPPAGQEMLGVFPLSQGASWTYTAVIDYDSQSGPQHFEGEITQTVVEATPHLESWVFRTELTGHPLVPIPAESDYPYYTVHGSGLYRFRDAERAAAATNPQTIADYAADQLLAWPLEVGQMWGDPALINAEGRNVWQVISGNVTIDLPARHFEGCYIISMLTNPDESHYTFCPGTGFVMYEYHHHGSRHDEIWQLVEFTPGS